MEDLIKAGHTFFRKTNTVGCTLYTSCYNKHYYDHDEELKEIHGSLGMNDFIKEKCNADKNTDRKNDECYAEPGNERGVKF
jgi:hypothetical protein